MIELGATTMEAEGNQLGFSAFSENPASGGGVPDLSVFEGKVIGISKWDEIFENSKTRKLETMTLFFNWPSGCESRGYVELVGCNREAGVLAFGVFAALCQFMGTLRRSSARQFEKFLHSNGDPMSLAQVAARIRIDVNTVARALLLLSSEGVQWVTLEESATCTPPARHPQPECDHGSVSGAGQKKKKKKKKKVEEEEGRGPLSSSLEGFRIQDSGSGVQESGSGRVENQAQNQRSQLADGPGSACRPVGQTDFPTQPLEVLSGRVALSRDEILGIVAGASPRIEVVVVEAWANDRQADDWRTRSKIPIGSNNWFEDLQRYARHWSDNASASTGGKGRRALAAAGPQSSEEWEETKF